MLYNKAIGATASGQKVYIEEVFQTFLYAGNGSTQTITNGIDLSGKGGLVWLKNRARVSDHYWIDTARGVFNAIFSNLTSTQGSRQNSLTAFTSTGFTVSSEADVNNSGEGQVSWTFRKAAKFFDVVTWSGDGSSSRSIAHSLGTTPGFIVVKRTSSTSDWWCWHRSISTGNLSGNNLIVLNSTAAQTNIGTVLGTASSTTFQVGGDSSVNANGGTYVAYLFAHDAGGFGDSGNDSIIKCGSFAHGSDTELENLGWEPQWVLVKSTSTGEWRLYDTLRGASTNSSQVLLANSAAAEVQNNVSSAACIVPRATGFNHVQFSFETFIYIAIRRGPMKTPTTGTQVFALDTFGGTAPNPPTYNAPFPVDFAISKTKNSTFDWRQHSRLQGLQFLRSNSTASELTDLDSKFDYMNGWYSASSVDSSIAGWMFRRAPGFFDVVAYAGPGSGTIQHNLGVKPQLIIVKNRGSITEWAVYAEAVGATQYAKLHLTDAFSTNSTWLNTEPTASVFSVSANARAGASGNNYIAYLFATCPGVSKVGSYTGTGTTLQVNCGFTNGARFVLIKRTDSTGDWYVWDTARGIVSGNDPFLLLNSPAVENTSTDYIDPLSTGFEISSTAPAAINANGGSFIFLAIA